MFTSIFRGLFVAGLLIVLGCPLEEFGDVKALDGSVIPRDFKTFRDTEAILI